MAQMTESDLQCLIAPEEGAEQALLIQNLLAATPYACSSLERLSGGVLNFTYRGYLSQALADGSPSVIIKYSRPCKLLGVAATTHRGEDEQRILEVVQSGMGRAIEYNGIRVQAPLPYCTIPSPPSQLMQDFVGTSSMLSFLQPAVSADLPSSFLVAFGRALGVWLKSFHARGSLPLDPELQQKLQRHDNNCQVRFDLMESVMGQVLSNNPRVFKGVEDEFNGYIQDKFYCEIQDAMCVAHGDFSTRNMLVSPLVSKGQAPTAIATATAQPNMDIIVIDWECYHANHIYLDIGEFIGDLYVLHRYKGSKACAWVLQGFADGYGPFRRDHLVHLAVSVAVQVLFTGHVVAEIYAREDIDSLAEFGRDLVLKAREGDWEWFESGFLGDIWRMSE